MLDEIRSQVRRIPRGKVSTYGAVAVAAGFPGRARQVVWALHNARGLPWHRVVGAGGRILLPGENGLEQRMRLETEGVRFQGGRVDMQLHEYSTVPAIRLRRFTDSDLRGLLKIERESFGPHAWPAALFREYAADRSAIFLVAEAGTNLAGYGIAAVTGDQAEIASIAIASRYRRHDLGTRTLSELIRTARRRGAVSIRLMVRRDNLAAIELYRKLGFRRVSTVRGYYEDGATGWRMRLSTAFQK